MPRQTKAVQLEIPQDQENPKQIETSWLAPLRPDLNSELSRPTLTSA
jgi:hypothetical protein